MNTNVQKNITFLLSLIILLSLNNHRSFADEDLEYVPVEPFIVTNYLKKSARKPGFVQLKAQLTVRGKIATEMVTKHMPLVRDFIITFLSFTEEAVIKDPAQRNRLRATLTKGLQKMLTEEVGNPLIEDFVITHFMWD